jgi:CheY-like chemotaxis protein
VTSHAPVRALRILVVEDDDDHAELILHVLREHHAGHRVERVADGADAIDYLERHRNGNQPDLVLLDLKLPRVGGLAVLERIKSDDVLRAVPVVVLTTSAADGDRARAYAAHANSYVVKPADFVSLEALLRDISSYWGQWNRGL